MKDGQSQDPQRVLHAIIPAGGAGTRLWPLSRADRPKFLLDLLDHGHSLLQETILRLAPIAVSVTIVTGQNHRESVRRQVERLRSEGGDADALDIRIVTEPSGRDSMPAIGLAAAVIARDYGADAIVGSFAADHAIADATLFRSVAARAAEGAQAGYVTTVGIQPQSPSTAFGYIEPTSDEIAPDTFRVARFVEKPPWEEAVEYVERGFLWNAGMFVMRADVALGHLRRLHPSLCAALERIAEVMSEDETRQDRWIALPSTLAASGRAVETRTRIPVALGEHGGVGSHENDSRMLPTAVETNRACCGGERSGKSSGADQIAREWQSVPQIAIDHALAEPVAAEGGVAVVVAPLSVGWSDVGDVQALAEEAPSSGGSLIEVDAQGGFVQVPPGKMVAVVGIDHAVVIDTGDALLVTTRENAQGVKDVVAELKMRGREDLI